MVKRARVIYNPRSGRETFKKLLPEILEVYEAAGYETSTFQTTAEPFSALKEAERCAAERFDLIVAAGGDGTIHEVINGIAEKEFRPTLAIIPAGTANDYARVLQIPRNNLVEAAKLIHNQESIFMDVGKVKTSKKEGYFMNIGALGNMTELTFEVSPQLKALFGYLAYVVKGAELLPQIKAVPVDIAYEGGNFEGHASLIFVALSDTVGGFNNIIPDKILGDGELSLIIVKTTNVLELMQLARKLLTDGSHLDSPHVIYKQTPFVDIKVLDDSPLMVNLDGEYGGDAPAHFENLNNHIEVIANVNQMEVQIDEPSDLKRAEMKSVFTQEVSSYEELIGKRFNEQNKNKE